MRDFYEYLRDTEKDYGPIKPPNGTKPEQARFFLTWNPAAVRLTPSTKSSKHNPASLPFNTPLPTQGTDNDVEMVDADSLHYGQVTGTTNMDDSKYSGLSHQVKHPTLYERRDSSLRITAERMDIPKNIQTGELQRLMVKFSNIGLSCERETQEANGRVL